MKTAKLLKLSVLLLAVMVIAKPVFRIVFFPIELHQSHDRSREISSMAQSRAKYDARPGNILVKAQDRISPVPFYYPARPVHLRHQSVLAGTITARHLLNIHFRILPDRKIFLQQGRLTV